MEFAFGRKEGITSVPVSVSKNTCPYFCTAVIYGEKNYMPLLFFPSIKYACQVNKKYFFKFLKTPLLYIDLVQETPEFRASSLSRPGSASCSPSSSLDLLNVVAASRYQYGKKSTISNFIFKKIIVREVASSASTEALHSSAGAARGRSRAADADPSCYKEEDYLPNGGGAASEEILTEVRFP